jgi:hypothetical protein
VVIKSETSDLMLFRLNTISIYSSALCYPLQGTRRGRLVRWRTILESNLDLWNFLIIRVAKVAWSPWGTMISYQVQHRDDVRTPQPPGENAMYLESY